MRIFSESELRRAADEVDAVAAVEGAFRALAEGKAVLPGVISLELPKKHGEYHVKGAWLEGSPYVVFKSAISYYDNPARGLPSSSGFFAVFDADTGALRAMLLDNGFLTHVRTGAAGAVAAKYLARKAPARLAILGCGTQARFQWRYFREVREVARIALWDARPEAAEAFAREIGSAGVRASSAASAEAAVRESDVIVTVTPSRAPIVKAEWLRPGTHVTAVGADDPAKQELDERVFERADLIIADRLAQCLERGDIHHAVAHGVITANDVDGEIGDLVTGRLPGRTRDDQITVCDLTGVGVQDAAIARAVLDRAMEMGLGCEAAE